jgi:glycosyltransferase involved in cell wall biosynthesis
MVSEPKKHILLLPAWYPSEEDPMFGLFVQNYAAMLSTEYKVTVLFYNSKAAKGREKSISIQSNKGFNEVGIHYYSSNKFLRIIGLFTGMHKAYKIVKTRFGKPDLVHVQILTRMAVFARIMNIRFGIPYVITEHWSRYLPEHKSYKGWLRKKITKRVCRKSNGMSAVSQYLANAMQNEGLRHAQPYHILYNVVDTDLFKLKHNISDRRIKQVIHVSCFENKSKNLTGMLDALALVKEKRSDFKVVLAGTGDDFDMICQYAEDLKLLDCVEFPGLISAEEVANYMRESDFYLQSSHYETLSVVIAEALCCGLPVLSTAVGAIPEIVNETNGMLVPDNAPKELAAAFDLMLDSCIDYSAEKIRENALNKFSAEAVRTRFNNFYNQIQ